MTQYDPDARAIVAHFFVGKAEKANATTQVALNAVCRGVANSMWAQYTPSGSIQMNILNDAIEMEVGDEYEVLFRKIVKPQPGDGHPIVEAITKNGQIVCETCGLGLGYTEQAVKTYGDHMRQYLTPEYKAEQAAQHDEVYGAAALT